MTSHNTLVLGIGNTLLSDEGAGIHALTQLELAFTNIEDSISSELLFLDGGTLSFTLAAYIEDCNNLIVFDAAELKSPAGTVKAFVGEEMDHFLGTTKRSAHEVGLLDLMDIARITDHLPENRALIGIQPEVMSWGMQPTDKIQAALPHAVDEASRLIHRWHELNSGQNNITSNQYHEDDTPTFSPCR